MSKKYLIIGHGAHGKDSFAEILCEITGLRFESSSKAALDAIFPSLNAIGDCFNKNELKSKKDAFSSRWRYRDLWKELITLYNTPDKSALCRKILESSDVYVGMRCDKEYQASKHLFDKVFWVDASERLDLEPSMKINYDPSMFFIDNNGDIYDLKAEARRAKDAILAKSTNEQ